MLSKLNSFSKFYKNKQIPYQICEICYKPNNLILCQICKNFYHLECLQIEKIPIIFTCKNCKEKLPKLNENLLSEKSSNIESKKLKKIKDKKIKNENNNNSNNNNNSKSKSKLGNKRKREKKENDLNLTKSKSKSKNLLNSIISNNNNNNNNNIIFPSEKKQRQSQIQRKNLEKIKKEREQRLLNSYDHNNPQYKRRKIKIGNGHQLDIYEFTDKYENKINFDEEEYERNDLKQVWSVLKNPFKKEEIDKYLNTAKLFWNYRNMFLENELCADFFEECENIMKKKKISEKLKNKIHQLMRELKELVRRGIDLNCHFDEMCLKMLHLCNYKMNVALLFLYKQFNPFIEEIEEGFKSDVYIFQNELFSIINDGDFYDPDE